MTQKRGAYGMSNRNRHRPGLHLLNRAQLDELLLLLTLVTEVHVWRAYMRLLKRECAAWATPNYYQLPAHHGKRTLIKHDQGSLERQVAGGLVVARSGRLLK